MIPIAISILLLFSIIKIILQDTRIQVLKARIVQLEKENNILWKFKKVKQNQQSKFPTV